MNARALSIVYTAMSAGLLGAAGVTTEARAQGSDALAYPDGTPHPMTPWGDPDLRGTWPIITRSPRRCSAIPSTASAVI